MLKFLTQKLRTHSLNEREKVEERDSGTESDDERPGEECGDDGGMKWTEVTDTRACGAGCACAEPPRAGRDPPHDPHDPHDPLHDPLHDPHSSEEELEVINRAPAGCCGPPPPRAPRTPRPPRPAKRKWSAARAHDDDDDTKVETPVRFRTSPPLEALKPRRSDAACVCGAAPCRPACPAAPRAAPPRAAPRRHRPALDFDKMQQLRAGGVRWRGAGGRGAGGELSVYCW